MSLMKMRETIQENSARTWRGREFRAPPSIGRIVLHAILAAVIGGVSRRSLLDGNESAAAGAALAATFGLLALVNWHRLQDALLPKRILCPSCEASIALSSEERRLRRFSCASCGEDFEVGEDQTELR